MSADEIARAYNLTIAQVYAALTYAFEHIEDMQRDARGRNPCRRGNEATSKAGFICWNKKNQHIGWFASYHTK